MDPIDRLFPFLQSTKDQIIEGSTKRSHERQTPNRSRKMIFRKLIF
ncbi:hypothetical protein HanXRQr2_Chr16g0745961 [Helianthus annuus]|uniref:Uncharacterized protein n=1 Tax=Helianthus annuus TaxID=4232 RepID=A0A9K3DT73_HELAN|nr:hypothetical protein HanXRQr2_Chr16g0745961 [Helianthus annuus]KAJ0821029.1 hypothetical protein HanPSC8_Chr16g0715181 [Helianthus annuus]